MSTKKIFYILCAIIATAHGQKEDVDSQVVREGQGDGY